jgi:hypothetical protein
MSIPLNKLLFNYETEKIDKICYGTDITINCFSKKFYIYNNHSVNPLQKYWLHIDRCKIIKNNNGTIVVALSWSESTQRLSEFMAILSDKIKECIKGSNLIAGDDMIIFNKYETCDTYAPTFELLITPETIVFDKNNISDNTILKNITDCALFVELDYIQILNNCIMPIWRVMQIKEFIVIDTKLSFFDMLNQPQPAYIPKKYHEPTVRHAEPEIIPHKIEKSTFSAAEPIKKPSFILNVSDLTNMIKKLKKPDEPKDHDSNDKPDNKPDNKPDLSEVETQITQLKKVIVKEPRTMVDILREEHQERQRADQIFKSIEQDKHNYDKFNKHNKKKTKHQNKKIEQWSHSFLNTGRDVSLKHNE